MAKMFYSLQETAEKLGVSEDDIRQMAGAGKIQQFRDRDKLMFKRDQVDSLASAEANTSGDADSIMEEATGLSTGSIPLDDTGLSTGEIPLTAGDEIDLAVEDDLPGVSDKNEDSRMATGISVFDAGEIDEADPHTQTIVQPLDDEEELALESVGSGSGLLDLTQESDDTSLGAELLDEIYPGGEGSDAMLESPASSSGVFDPGFSGGSGASGLEYHAAAPAETVFVETEDMPDPAGNGLAIGFMLVGFLVVVVAFMVGLASALNMPISLTQQLAGAGEVAADGSGSPIIMYAGIGLGAMIVFGLIGFFVGKSKA